MFPSPLPAATRALVRPTPITASAAGLNCLKCFLFTATGQRRLVLAAAWPAAQTRTEAVYRNRSLVACQAIFQARWAATRGIMPKIAA